MRVIQSILVGLLAGVAQAGEKLAGVAQAGEKLAGVAQAGEKLAGVAQAGEKEALLQGGAYEVQVRLELPNVPNAAATSIRTICVPDDAETSPLPVLSANNPLARCPARNVRRDGAILSFDIVCDGRGAARAHAVYTLMPREFGGRIAMVMGGKNMTMTEVQDGRRVGDCDPASAPRN